MKKYNLSKIMKRAWEMVKEFGMTISEGLKKAWSEAKAACEKIAFTEYTKQLVTIDGNIITGEGPAAAFPYAYAILEIFAGKAVADQLREGMMFNHLTAK